MFFYDFFQLLEVPGGGFGATKLGSLNIFVVTIFYLDIEDR